MTVPPALRRRLGPVVSLARKRRLPLFVVGGCVRDWLLGRATRDIDLVTEGNPLPLAEDCVRAWGGSLEPFGRFGTVRLSLKKAGLRFDFARARAESYARPGALPDVRPATLREDLVRRDFTVNAMALPLGPGLSGEVIDLHGGVKDLRARRLRVLHPGSFKDDPTRLFRAARYAGRFSFRLASETRSLVAEAVKEDYPGLLSRERLRQELLRILDEKDPGPALRLAAAWGLDAAFHPRFRWPARAAAGSGPFERLGLVVLAMPDGEGENFLRSLPLERQASSELALALKQARLRCSPRGKLPALTRRVLALHFPRLPPGALEPLWVGGADLKALGLSPGRDFATWLEDAASAQWRGEFGSPAEARRWLAETVRD